MPQIWKLVLPEGEKHGMMMFYCQRTHLPNGIVSSDSVLKMCTPVMCFPAFYLLDTV